MIVNDFLVKLWNIYIYSVSNKLRFGVQLKEMDRFLRIRKENHIMLTTKNKLKYKLKYIVNFL